MAYPLGTLIKRPGIDEVSLDLAKPENMLLYLLKLLNPVK